MGFIGLSQVFFPQSANAHAQLVATFPQDGSSIQYSPAEIVMSWGEDIRSTKTGFSIINTLGERFDFKYNYTFAKNTHEGSVSLTPIKKLPKAAYLVSWKVISHDGHPIAGTFTFGMQTNAVAAKNSAATSRFEQILQSAFWLLLIVAFGAVIGSRRRLFENTLLVAIFLSLARLSVTYFNLRSSFLFAGTTKISFISLIGLSLGYTVSRNRTAASVDKSIFPTSNNSRNFFGLLLLSIFASQSLFEGHALDLGNARLLMLISAAHLVFAFLWSGSVVSLLLNTSADQYRRTRQVSTVSIFGLVLMGTILFISLGQPFRFASKSSWTIYFIIKVGFILTGLGLGAFHHFAGKKIANSNIFSLRKTLAIEMACFIGVLFSTSSLVSYTPPKVMANQFDLSNSITQSTAIGGYLQTPFKFNNGMKGILYVQDVKQGKPAMIMVAIKYKDLIKTKSMDSFLSNKEINLSDMHVVLKGSNNQYMSYATLPKKGIWRFNLEILIDDFNGAQASFDARI
jgi:copper transport protein